MPKEKPLLKVKVSGPAIRPGRIPVPLLVDICQQTQRAVNWQAEALEGRPNLRPGPITKNVVRECTLELIGLKKGSTTLNFVPVSEQNVLPEIVTLRTEAIHGVALALKSVAKTRGGREAVDLGLLVVFDELGKVLDKGVNKLQLIVPSHNGYKRNTIAELTPATLPRIKARLQLPLPSSESSLLPDASIVEGTIEITEGKGRITPLFGSPTTFSFDQKQAEDVYQAVHKPAKAKVDPKTHKLKNIKVATPKGDFFAAKTIDQLTAEQGVHPITNLEALSGLIPDEDIDAFVAEIYRDRTA